MIFIISSPIVFFTCLSIKIIELSASIGNLKLDNGITSAAGLRTLNLVLVWTCPVALVATTYVLVLTERNSVNRVLPHSDPHSDQSALAFRIHIKIESP